MWNEVGYVKISKYRKKVLISISKGPKISSKIAEDIEVKNNYVFKTLKELKEHNLIMCINPEVRKVKIYKLTDLGKKVVEKI